MSETLAEMAARHERLAAETPPERASEVADLIRTESMAAARAVLPPELYARLVRGGENDR